MHWFTADLHLGHENIIKYCNRPFEYAAQMDIALLNRINQVVRKHDTLWVVGDFSLKPAYHIAHYLDELVCKDVRLVRGNHDIPNPGRIFKHVYDIKEMRFNDGQKVVLCHYPLLSWRASHHGSWHLYGHVHGTLKHPSKSALDVGVDVHNFTPLNEEDITVRIKKAHMTV